MLNFYKVLKLMENDGEIQENKVINLVRKINELDGKFWANFQVLCSDSLACSSLLDVPRPTIAKWSGKITEALSLVSKMDDEKLKNNKNSTMIQTGISNPQDIPSPSAGMGEDKFDTADTRTY